MKMGLQRRGGEEEVPEAPELYKHCIKQHTCVLSGNTVLFLSLFLKGESETKLHVPKDILAQILVNNGC